MAYYYTSLTSICKNILPFSFKKRRIPAITAAEQRLSKQQSDNLKWQQESFHQMLKLMGLCKEGILDENEVSAFRTHLIDTITSPASMDYEPPLISRDKLIFLKELLHANCISEDEYHASKKPLLRSLAAQGAKIRESDVIVEAHNDISSEEWIDFKEKKQGATTKGHSFVADLVSQDKKEKSKEDKHFRKRNMNTTENELVCCTENPFWNHRSVSENESESKSILMMEILPGKKKPPFRSLFQRNQKEEEGLSVKRMWGGYNGFKKNDIEDETAPLSLGEKCRIDEGRETKTTKNNLHQCASHPNFLVDEKAIIGEKVKNELSQITAKRSPRLNLLDNQMEDIPTRQPDDSADLKDLFPESWCNQHVLLDVVRKKVEGHNVGEMGSSQVTTKDSKQRWSTFDDEENTHPNLFAPQWHSYNSMLQDKFTTPSMNARTSFNKSSIDRGFGFNPFSEM